VHVVLVVCFWGVVGGRRCAFPSYITTQALILNGWFDSAPVLVEGAFGFSTLLHYPGVNFKWVVWFWGVIGGRRLWLFHPTSLPRR